MSILPFGLLGGGLALLLFSLLQFRLWKRVIILVLAAASILSAAWLGVSAGGATMFSESAAWLAGDRLGALWDALWGNRLVVRGLIWPLFDVFLALSVVFTLLAFFALTPGEAMERAIRPVGAGIVGAVLGAFVALAVFAIGFGAYEKRRVYVGFVSAEDVVDGDGFKLGDVAFRLAGIDAPESGQICYASPPECGDLARDALMRATSEGLVVCRRADQSEPELAPPESFGRPMVQCFVRTSDGGEFDLAERLAKEGHAVEWVHGHGEYADDVTIAADTKSGLWKGCTLRPSVWRNDRGARRAFVERRELPSNESDVIGIENCPPPLLSSDNPR